MQTRLNYINGQWQPALLGHTRDILNPANGDVIGVVADSTAEDTLQAIAAAKHAFYEQGDWRHMSGPRRADMLYRIADAIRARTEELALLDCLDNGKPLREARCDIEDAAACFRYYAGLIGKPQGGVYEVPDGFGPMHAYSLHEPVGVCGLITPWNYPLLMATWKLAPALAAGNCVVFKPSELTPLSSVVLFEIFHEVGLPAGTANLVLGRGPAAGQPLADSHDVDMITFTGSTRTGQLIARAAVGNLKRVGLELGGKSPNIILPDCPDLARAARTAAGAIFYNMGEMCTAGSRLLVHKDIKDAFLAEFKKAAAAYQPADPLDPATSMGAIVDRIQYDKVLGYIAKAREENCELVCGGHATRTDEGLFIQPTAFVCPRPDMTICREEIFGPVLSIITFSDVEEAIRIANDTEYGLAAAVWTSNVTTAHQVSRRLRAGTVWVNCYDEGGDMNFPFGGFKQSGNGRDKSLHAFDKYTEIKATWINLGS